MSGVRRRVRAKSHANHERWLVSYADFITLLFAFFVVLYATSKADQKKQAQVAQAINSAFQSLGVFTEVARKPSDAKSAAAINRDGPTVDQPVTPMNIVMGEEVLSPAQVKEDLERMKNHLDKMLSNEIAQHTVSIQMGKDGLVISLREAGFFSSGSATPHPATLPVLKQIGEVLGAAPYNVRVEGHTDDVPIHTAEFDSNWELSSARATRVARVFLSTHSVPPTRLSAAGYAEFHPVAKNDTEAGRGENRRVDLVVQPQTSTNLSVANGDTAKENWHKVTDQ